MSCDPCRTACAENCAEYGDPPCYELDAGNGLTWSPCDDCLREVGIDAPLPLDPAAVIAPLL